MRRVPRCEHAGSLILGEHAEESKRETSQRGLPASFGAEEQRVLCATCGASDSVVHSQVDRGTPGAMAAVPGKGAFPFCVQTGRNGGGALGLRLPRSCDLCMRLLEEAAIMACYNLQNCIFLQALLIDIQTW